MKKYNTLHTTCLQKSWQWLLIGCVMLLTLPVFAQDSIPKKTIPVIYNAKDSNAIIVVKKNQLDTSIQEAAFSNALLLTIKQKMQAAGYYGFSIDTSYISNDSLFIDLYAGPALQKLQLTLPDDVLPYINSIIKNNTIQIAPSYFDTLSNNILLKASDKGYPFAQIQLENITFTNTVATATVMFNTGFQYKIDSVHVEDPEFLINKNFLIKYIGLKENTFYSTALLNNITDKINRLPYIQLNKPPNLELLNTGAYVNLDLKHKNANKANILLGVVPANNSTANVIGGPTPVTENNKYSIIGEAAISTWNLLGSGEYMSLRFEQLIPKHPKFNLLVKVPYILKSNFPLETSFELYRRDSLFLNLQASVATEVETRRNQFIKFGLNWLQTNALGFNVEDIRANKKLPQYIDSRFIGALLQYKWNNTENIFYPLKQGDIIVKLQGGTRTIKKNNSISTIKDPSNPVFDYGTLYDTINKVSPQVKWNALIQKFIPLKKLKIIKASWQMGAIVSNKIFFNEQFLLGGIKTIRGFDEESQPASLFGIGSVEYRLPAGNNAYFSLFSDGAWLRASTLNNTRSLLYGSFGLGIAINARGGVFVLNIANGKRSDEPNFSFRRTKMHLSYEVKF
jgi:outer membrane protein assembly factor BamA